MKGYSLGIHTFHGWLILALYIESSILENFEGVQTVKTTPRRSLFQKQKLKSPQAGKCTEAFDPLH